MPLSPAVSAKLDSMSPSMMEYARAAPSGVRKQLSVTTHELPSPTSFFHMSPIELDFFSDASLIRPSMKKEYALRRPRPTTMMEAGTSAADTSPMAATPAGRARTPLPTQALIRLKVAALMPVLPDSDSSPFAAAADFFTAPPRKSVNVERTSPLPFRPTTVPSGRGTEMAHATADEEATIASANMARRWRRDGIFAADLLVLI
mmetsp:Transcript_58068/g.173308  ORF Transcript_58068/g.173308 Transcript_58068/m.173308 type:complete len:204 (-) Transcript_58068:81-692(-)